MVGRSVIGQAGRNIKEWWVYLVGDSEGQTETGGGGFSGVGADCMKGCV